MICAPLFSRVREDRLCSNPAGEASIRITRTRGCRRDEDRYAVGALSRAALHSLRRETPSRHTNSDGKEKCPSGTSCTTLTVSEDTPGDFCAYLPGSGGDDRILPVSDITYCKKRRPRVLLLSSPRTSRFPALRDARASQPAMRFSSHPLPAFPRKNKPYSVALLAAYAGGGVEITVVLRGASGIVPMRANTDSLQPVQFGRCTVVATRARRVSNRAVRGSDRCAAVWECTVYIRHRRHDSTINCV